MVKLLIATGNEGKLKEFRELLKNTEFSLFSLNNFNVRAIAETGLTFMENAELKASGYALQTNHWTLADDSGLEVKALGGAPGVLSARYSGSNPTDRENNKMLIDNLAQTADIKRLARFVCAIAVSDPTGQIRFRSRGNCVGRISFEEKGENGFGYDSVFIPDGFNQTFGELDSAVKQDLSHRSKAIRKIINKMAGISVF